MKIKLLFAMLVLFHNLIFGQGEKQYKQFIKEASKFYNAKEYKKSVKKYEEAFKLTNKVSSEDRYNAACSYALAGKLKHSFFHLFKLAKNETQKFRDYKHLTTDTDLKALHKYKEWQKLLRIVKANKEEYEKDLDKYLLAKLDTIYERDQKYRKQFLEIQKKYGMESKEMMTNIISMKQADAINLVEVTKILDNRGWLGANIVGEQGNSTLFLVIQHADMNTQLKYLPMMRKAVAKGNADASDLALLEDRVALKQGKKQIYGSQIEKNTETGELYVLPIKEPEKVNQRREKVGLMPIEEYLSHFGLTWDLEKHKKINLK